MQRLRQQVTLLQKQLLQGKGNIDFRNDNATSGSNSSSNGNLVFNEYLGQANGTNTLFTLDNTPTQSKNCKKYIGCFSTSLIGRFLPTESLKGRSTRECSEFRPKRSMSINAVILILDLYSCFAPREHLEDPFDFLIKIFFQNREHLINI